ncbi:MAG: hypothetical protein C0475_07145 [Planctomyces sp.]|nr:hypothetical protein [Planctomyces sp.]
MPPPIFRPAAVALSLLCLAAPGCRSTIADPLDTAYDRADPQQELLFWHSLPSRSAVTNDELLHAMLLFADAQDPAGSYQERRAAAVERRWLPAGFDEPANLAAQRGHAAVMLARVLDLRSGVWLTLLGPTPRYALRQLQDLGIMPPGSEQQPLSGLELLDAISAAQDEQARRGAAPASVLSPPAPPLPPTQPAPAEPREAPASPSPPGPAALAP